MAYTVLAYMVMAYVVMAYIVMAFIVVAFIVMAYIVMAYIVYGLRFMAYIVMAYGQLLLRIRRCSADTMDVARGHPAPQVPPADGLTVQSLGTPKAVRQKRFPMCWICLAFTSIFSVVRGDCHSPLGSRRSPTCGH